MRISRKLRSRPHQCRTVCIFGYWLLGITTIWVLGSCAGIVPPKLISDPEAVALINNLKSANPGLTTLKGIGKITLVSDTQSRSARFAWAGRLADSLRLELMTVTGQPFIALAWDGHQLYFMDHQQGRYHHRFSKDANLKPIVHFSVTGREILHLLGGRIPLATFDHAQWIAPAGGGEQKLLLLNRGGEVLQKIYFNGARQRVDRYEMFDHSGALIYTAVIDAVTLVEGYQLPTRISAIGAHGDRLSIDCRRYWINPHLDPGVFVLPSPDKQG